MAHYLGGRINKGLTLNRCSLFRATTFISQKHLIVFFPTNPLLFLCESAPLVMSTRRQQITFPIKVKPEVGFDRPWRPGRTEHTLVCCAAASTRSPKKENGQKAPCPPPGSQGRVSQFGHQQSLHHFLSLQFLPECLCTEKEEVTKW